MRRTFTHGIIALVMAFTVGSLLTAQSTVYRAPIFENSAGPTRWRSGSVNPEGAATDVAGSFYTRTDGTLWIKASGSTSAGWRQNYGDDPTIAAIAGQTGAADKIVYFNGADTAALTTLTSFARTLIDDATAGDARTTLGAYGSGDSPTFTRVTTTGNGLLAGGVFASTLDTTGLSGPVAELYYDTVNTRGAVDCWNYTSSAYCSLLISGNPLVLVSASNMTTVRNTSNNSDTILAVYADRGDDAADRWTMTAKASSARFELSSGSAGLVAVAESSKLTVYGIEGTAARLTLCGDDGDDAIDCSYIDSNNGVVNIKDGNDVTLANLTASQVQFPWLSAAGAAAYVCTDNSGVFNQQATACGSDSLADAYSKTTAPFVARDLAGLEERIAALESMLVQKGSTK